MPICSYLLTPSRGKSDSVLRELSKFPEVEVYPAENSELMVIVTETTNQIHENDLNGRLINIDGINCLALSFGAMN